MKTLKTVETTTAVDCDWPEDLLRADGLNDAIIGVVQQFNKRLICYDREKVLAILVRRDGMNYSEAEEFFEYNIQGAWVGEGTPAFFVPVSEVAELSDLEVGADV